MKISPFVFFGTLFSAGIFYLAYNAPGEQVVASTGYYAFDRGFCGWDYSYTEGDHVWNGHHHEWTITREGHQIRYPRLIAEMALCSGLGFGLVAFIRIFFTDWKRRALFPPTPASEW